MKKRLLALLAALTLALALTACGGETNTEEPDEPPQQVQDHAVQLLQAQGAKPVPKILSLQAAKHLDPIRHTILLSLHFSTIVFYKNRHGKSIYKTHKIGNSVRQ